MSMSPENAGEPWLDDEYRTAGSPVFLRSEASDRLEISEYSLKVGGELYRVRRAVDRDMQGGFVTIHDSCGKPVLVFSAAFPDEHVHHEPAWSGEDHAPGAVQRVEGSVRRVPGFPEDPRGRAPLPGR